MEVESGTEAKADGEARLARLTAERDGLRARLTEAEQLLAEMPDLRADREELERLRNSGTWRATAPFRRLWSTIQRELLPGVRLGIKRKLLGLARRARGRT